MGLDARVTMLAAALMGLAGPLTVHTTATASMPAKPAARAVGRQALASTVRVSVSTREHACPAGLVALTFDDGPARGLTARLVRILEHEEVPGTFFMVGSRVRTAPRGARLVGKAGFTVGNHTWSHPRLTRLTDGAVRSEIRRTAAELHKVGVPATTLMRPPYGDINGRVRADVRAMDLVPVLWDVDSNDWRGGSAGQIARSILRQLRPHQSNIVLQHDGVRNSPASVAAVRTVIRAARHRGYCFTDLGLDGRMTTVETDAETPPETMRSRMVTPFDDMSARARS